MKKIFWINAIICISILFPAVINAGNYTSNYQSQQQKNNENKLRVSNDYPYNTDPKKKIFTNPTILKDRFELNIDKIIAKDVNIRMSKFNKIMDNTFDLSILQEPIYKTMQNIDTIYIHPQYLTTIIFPLSMEIQYAKSSFEPLDLSFSQNMLMIQPKKDFLSGNAIITLSNKHKNFVMNIIFKKYDKNMLTLDEQQRRYITKDKHFLSLTYRYIQQPKINKIALFKKFIMLNNLNNEAKLKKYFPTNGAYHAFVIKGVPIFITRNDKFGNLVMYGTSFNITNKFLKVQ